MDCFVKGFIKRICAFCVFAWVLFGVNANAATLVVNSEPTEAEVFVQKLSGGTPKRIGKSPLTIDFRQITTTFTQEDTFVLIVERRGYEPKRYILSSLLNADVKINVVLDLDNNLKLMHEFDKTASVLLEALRKIRKKNYQDAISILEPEAQKFPHLSIIPEMQGSAAYLKKDLNKAQDYYSKSISNNPQNTDAYRMKLMIDAMLGQGAKK